MTLKNATLIALVLYTLSTLVSLVQALRYEFFTELTYIFSLLGSGGLILFLAVLYSKQSR